LQSFGVFGIVKLLVVRHKNIWCVFRKLQYSFIFCAYKFHHLD
jgi:hypothetical protein